MHAIPSFELYMYARVLTAHSLRRNCPKLRSSEWAVGAHACIQPQKGERKPSHSMHFPYNPIDFASFNFRYCPQFTHSAHAPVKQS